MSNLSMNATKGPPMLTKEQACAAPIQPTFIGLTVLLIVILIVTFIGNLLILLAVIFFRRLRGITNYFIFSLAVSDLLISLLSLPFRIDQNRHNGLWCLNLEVCKTWLVVDTLCSFASIWNLAIISIDRFVAITLPFQYHSLITTKVGYGMISSVWTYSIFLTLMMFVNWTKKNAPHFSIVTECANNDPVYYTVVVSLSFFLPLLIILVMYGLVFQVALKQTRAMAALQVNMGRGRGGRRGSINLIREVKAAKTLAVVVGCFVVCWLPFNIIFMFLLWKGEVFSKLSPQQRQGIALTFIYILPALNSTMNPIIYALFNRDFRSAFLKLAKRITGRRLGAVGYGGTMDSSSAITTIHDEHDRGPSKNIRFKEQDSDNSDNSLPTIPPLDLNSYNNEGYTEQMKPVDNDLNINNDTRSMETTLDDDKKTKTEDTSAAEQNGHVSNDVTQYDADVIPSNNNVTQSNNDDKTDDAECSPKVDLSIKLPPLQRSPSSSTENDGLPEAIVKPNTLPPIESNNHDISTKNFDNEDEKSSETVPYVQDNITIL